MALLLPSLSFPDARRHGFTLMAQCPHLGNACSSVCLFRLGEEHPGLAELSGDMVLYRGSAASPYLPMSLDLCSMKGAWAWQVRKSIRPLQEYNNFLVNIYKLRWAQDLGLPLACWFGSSETRAWQESKSSPWPQRGRADQIYGQDKCTNTVLSLIVFQLQLVFIFTYSAGRLGVSSNPCSELCGALTSSRTALSAAQQQHAEDIGTGAGRSVAALCSLLDLPRWAHSSDC